jgi:hypothetical protein
MMRKASASPTMIALIKNVTIDNAFFNRSVSSAGSDGAGLAANASLIRV